MGDSPPGVLGTNPSAFAGGSDLDSTLPPGAAGAGTRGPAGTCAPVSHSTGLQMCGWPRKIAWGEFKELARAPAGVKEDAEIHSEGGGDDNMTVNRVGKNLVIASMTVTMTVEDDSWVVKGKQSDYLLNHEQGHFDITALLWRDLANEIFRIRARTIAALQREVNQVRQRLEPVFEEMTERYDTETNHSLNRDIQKKWDEKIRDAMKTGRALR